jgi:hypothetical protein
MNFKIGDLVGSIKSEDFGIVYEINLKRNSISVFWLYRKFLGAYATSTGSIKLLTESTNNCGNKKKKIAYY